MLMILKDNALLPHLCAVSRPDRLSLVTFSCRLRGEDCVETREWNQMVTI